MYVYTYIYIYICVRHGGRAPEKSDDTSITTNTYTSN